MCRSNLNCTRITLLTLALLELVFGITVWVFNIARLYINADFTTLALSDQVLLTFLFPVTALLGILASSSSILNSGSHIAAHVLLILHAFLALACIGWSIRAFDIVYVVVRPIGGGIGNGESIVIAGNLNWFNYAASTELEKLTAMGNARRWTAFGVVLALTIAGDIFYLLSAVCALCLACIVWRNARRASRFLESARQYRTNSAMNYNAGGIYNQGFGSQDLQQLQQVQREARTVTKTTSPTLTAFTPVPPSLQQQHGERTTPRRVTQVAAVPTTNNVTTRRQSRPVANVDNDVNVEMRTLAQSATSSKRRSSPTRDVATSKPQNDRSSRSREPQAKQFVVQVSTHDAERNATASRHNRKSRSASRQRTAAGDDKPIAKNAESSSSDNSFNSGTAVIPARPKGKGSGEASAVTSTSTVLSSNQPNQRRHTADKTSSRVVVRKQPKPNPDEQRRQQLSSALPSVQRQAVRAQPELLHESQPVSSQRQQRAQVAAPVIMLPDPFYSSSSQQQHQVPPMPPSNDPGYLSDEEGEYNVHGDNIEQHDQQLDEQWLRPQIAVISRPTQTYTVQQSDIPRRAIAIPPSARTTTRAMMHRSSMPENVYYAGGMARQPTYRSADQQQYTMTYPDDEEYFSSVAGFEGYSEQALERWQAARQQQQQRLSRLQAQQQQQEAIPYHHATTMMLDATQREPNSSSRQHNTSANGGQHSSAPQLDSVNNHEIEAII